MFPSATLHEIQITEYRLRLSRPLSPGEATQLRGYFGTAFGDEMLLHHHCPDGGLHYDYPRVQFKVIERTARLIGIGEGGALVERLWKEVEEARLGGEVLPVLEATLQRRKEVFGDSADPVGYRFLTPWLGLNQDNHRKYCRARNETERRELLSRVLVGNCLALAKSLGHRVQIRLAVDPLHLRPRACQLKGVPMAAFTGSFSINFHLPAGLGIGKSVSRGFGTVEPGQNLQKEASC
jgi:hypothetical protein